MRIYPAILSAVILLLVSWGTPDVIRAAWIENGTPISTADDTQYIPEIVSDGAGGAIVAWQDKRNVDSNIYGVRINCSGNVHPTPADDIPQIAFLAQNHPNPFNPVTAISFGLAKPVHVTLRIYDVTGRLVRVLVDESRAADRYEVTWDGHDSTGRQAASGVYFYKLNADAFEKTRKMVLLR